MKILIYGYGNPGRQDDALGIRLTENIEKWIISENISGVETDCNYQLNIEDAARISESDIVIFADATIEDIDDLAFTTINPDDSKIEFSMHAVSPAFVLDLCRKIYNKCPETYLLHIKGYEWDFKEELSSNAIINLEKAIKFTKQKISEFIKRNRIAK
ncbi:MAG: hydrogenase maturation protease [Bacteroidetes bacterium]|nr:hydrogenase maturation protease [Bacteroidota bacterium]